jgi:hypothetical protein
MYIYSQHYFKRLSSFTEFDKHGEGFSHFILRIQ